MKITCKDNNNYEYASGQNRRLRLRSPAFNKVHWKLIREKWPEKLDQEKIDQRVIWPGEVWPG